MLILLVGLAPASAHWHAAPLRAGPPQPPPARARSSITRTTTAATAASGPRPCSEKRDLYVYLPPGFDPHKRYPVILWLHGFAQDEQSFLDYVVEPLDQAMACGQLPPAIVAAPDGSLSGRGGITFLSAGSFFVNSKAGNFEDYLMADVWDFLFEPLPDPAGARGPRHGRRVDGRRGGLPHGHQVPRPRRGGRRHLAAAEHALGGLPRPLHGQLRPGVLGLAHRLQPRPRGRRPLLRRRHHPAASASSTRSTAAATRRRRPQISRDNPIEMLERYDVKPGELEMYVAYGGKDQFNIDAQVESFLLRRQAARAGRPRLLRPRGQARPRRRRSDCSRAC